MTFDCYFLVAEDPTEKLKTWHETVTFQNISHPCGRYTLSNGFFYIYIYIYIYI